MPELTYREAVRDALSQAMRGDERIFLMGEDIAEMGGSMGVTQGMLDEFGPERLESLLRDHAEGRAEHTWPLLTLHALAHWRAASRG